MRAQLLVPIGTAMELRPFVNESLPIGRRQVEWMTQAEGDAAILAGTHSTCWWHADLDSQWEIVERDIDEWDVVA